MVEFSLRENYPQIITFIAEWDEEIGPKVLDKYPKIQTVDLGEIADNIFLSFQTVFGNDPGVKFDRTNLILPLKSQKRIAKTVLDSYENSTLRGGFQPFIHVILIPLGFPEENMLVFNDIQNELTELYKNTREIDLQKYHLIIMSIIEKLSNHFHSQGEQLRKEKKYENSINAHKKSVFMSKIIHNKEKSDRYQKFLNHTLIETGKNYFKKGKRAYRQNKMQLSVTFYNKAEILFEEAQDYSSIRKVRKKSKKMYKKWVSNLIAKGDNAKHHNELETAYEYYSKAVLYAKKTGKRSLIKKSNKKLGKVPKP